MCLQVMPHTEMFSNHCLVSSIRQFLTTPCFSLTIPINNHLIGHTTYTKTDDKTSADTPIGSCITLRSVCRCNLDFSYHWTKKFQNNTNLQAKRLFCGTDYRLWIWKKNVHITLQIPHKETVMQILTRVIKLISQ